jgi:CheY-like chemotaxis protein
MEHILNVEDDPIHAYLTERVLREHYHVHTVGQDDQLWDVLAYEDIRLILMATDLRAPGSSGIDLLKDIRREDNWKHLPVLALTAYAMPGDQKRFLDMGFDGCLAKPFQPSDLVHSVRQLV